MSGTSFIKAWSFAPKKDLTERLAKSLGWDGKEGEKGILETLESASAKDIVEAEAKLLTKDENFSEHIMFPFTPVIEPYVNEKTFLPKDPVLLGRETWSNDIDSLIGVTSLEGGMMLVLLSDPQCKFHEFFEDSASFTLTRELGLDMEKPSDRQKAAEYGEKLKKLYFGEGPISADMRNQYLSVIE